MPLFGTGVAGNGVRHGNTEDDDVREDSEATPALCRWDEEVRGNGEASVEHSSTKTDDTRVLLPGEPA
jgi:hypothetical protein